jgi:selenocysteine lyase/cysteine desulfurase
LGASLAQINEIGIQNIHRHIMDLSRHLRIGLQELGATLISPIDLEENGSGITTFNVFDTPDQDRLLLDKLLGRNIYLAQRYTSGVGGLRASTHFYNNQEDVQALLDTLRDLCG